MNEIISNRKTVRRQILFYFVFPFVFRVPFCSFFEKFKKFLCKEPLANKLTTFFIFFEKEVEHIFGPALLGVENFSKVQSIIS